MLDPNNYIEKKNDLEAKVKLLEDIYQDREIDIYSNIVTLQNDFLNCFKQIIKSTKSKKDMMKLIYQFRYYQYIPIEKGKFIKDIEEIKEELVEVKKRIIEKAIKLGVINEISIDKKINFEILNEIFESRIIKLENMVIKIEHKKQQIEIYDEEVHEKTFTIKYKLNSKLKKKNKIFN